MTIASSSSFSIARTGSKSFLNYLKEIQKFPILTQQEEYDYGIKFIENGDKEAARFLIQSHLRLVVKIASKFKNYGLPIVDLVSEGNIGLIQAVKKFDPRKGFRLSTYAMWWIKAYIQEYILHSWSLVKIGTTTAQKKLFFNLHKIKKKISESLSASLSKDQVTVVANTLGVSDKEVLEMDSRLSQSDYSLNLVVDEESEAESGDLIACQDSNQEEIAIENQEKSRQLNMIESGLQTLNEREKDIIFKRQMSENPTTLEELSQFYKVSRERIRQIEENAVNKIKKEVKKLQNKFSV
jgi:RNA polymerase sigma-32 factor